MTADLYDVDNCPRCGKAGYTEIRLRKEADFAEIERRRLRSHYVYRVYDADAVLLYAGVTNDLAERWRKHRRESEWARYAERFWLVGPFNRPEAVELEKSVIRDERPLWNIAGRGSRLALRPEIDRYLAHAP